MMLLFRITIIDVLGPVGLQQSSLTQDTSRPNTFQKTLTWQTSETDIGDHIVCGNVVNEIRKTGDARCFTISIVQDPCDSDPCLNGGTCQSGYGNFTCTCVVGFTGKRCEINIDDCLPKPCKNGGVCHDLLNDYVCVCVSGYTDKNCSTDIDDCVSDPCMHEGSCTDQVNDFTCDCPSVYTGKNCHIALSLVTFNLLRRCTSGFGSSDRVQVYRAKHPPTQRSSSLTERWINHQMTSVESANQSPTSPTTAPAYRRPSSFLGIGGRLSIVDQAASPCPPAGGSSSATPMNIYRASFNDEGMHSTGPKKHPDTYTSGGADWGSSC
ncbi:hypothetical protein EGW08_012596 [Elysia chlorotica]|uniref:EGF-like domain-containing protein n=1 Tax=Elysia chlorotica TaxID=188477 RepID=A0A3S0ZIF3_ELYCH|nr:hypothetical protein EGW08_012596 [Elysia chlorotica]